MKLAIISVIVLYALVEASSGQVVVGTLITGKGNPVECMTEDYGPKCSTCTTLTLCDGDIPLTTITCSSPQPYCDPTVNMCTSVKPVNCPSSTFVCPMEGYFPDAENCDTYFNCTAEKTFDEYKCPANYVFDISIKGCKPLNNPTDCITMMCTKADEFIFYSKDPSIYVYCDSTLSAVMFKCPNNQEFDIGVGACKPMCTCACRSGKVV